MIRKEFLLLFLATILQLSQSNAQNNCPKATDLAASEITEVSAKLSWTGSSNHTEYTVDVMHGAQTSNFKYSTKTTATEAQVDGLLPGSNYRFRVKPKCEKGSGGSSQWFSFTTAGDKPGDESNGGGNGEKCPDLADLAAVDISDTSATLTWNNDPAYVSFKVTVMHAPQQANYKWSGTTSDTSVTITDLRPGRKYRFRVQASCDKGKSNSQWVTFGTTGIDSTGHGRCPKASNLAVLDVTDTSATLTWLGNPENVQYQVDVHQKEHTPQYRLSETVDTTALEVTGLSPGGNYKFRVKASCEKNSAGSSSWINFVTTGGDTTFNQCPKPRNLSVLEVSDTSALLSWVARDSAVSFDLEIKSFQGTPSYHFDTTLVDTFYFVSDLQPEGNYHFRVKANCTDTSSSGSSDWSKFRTLEDTSSESISTEVTTQAASISTFPNPVSEEFNIQLPTEKLGHTTLLILTDLQGRIVYRQEIDGIPTQANVSIPTHTLISGLYKLVVRSVDFLESKTIFVE